MQDTLISNLTEMVHLAKELLNVAGAKRGGRFMCRNGNEMDRETFRDKLEGMLELRKELVEPGRITDPIQEEEHGQNKDAPRTNSGNHV